MLLVLTYVDSFIHFLLRVFRAIFGSEIKKPDPIQDEKPDPIQDEKPDPIQDEKYKPRFIDIRGAFIINGENYPLRDPKKIKYFVIHHTASPAQNPSAIDEMHKKRGWPKISYHFGIDEKATVYYLNDASRNTNTVKGMNTQVLSCALFGDFTDEIPSEDMCKAAAWVYDLVNEKSAIPLAIAEHRDFVPTECPGNSFEINMVKKYINDTNA